eukprot:TRINITY_DN37276_c0_g1_i2.p2 TRINITY_DN37276_c0_g1~~TRINITY_DN37276_c0_g1_i2.p2  ORF type:complete len:115 (-),score=22.84 TRINITY_DN37276_c0_g1_i2:29-373(-)
MEDDRRDSCIVVTHSNLIRGMLNRFGAASLSGGVSPDSDPAPPEGVATLRQAGADKLQNAGVLGVKCVLAGVYARDGPRGGEPAWIATDALLMFGSSYKPAGAALAPNSAGTSW